jgi:sulfur carrier protein
MQVFINQLPLPETCSIEQALQAVGFKPPFAVALNLSFVPKTQYAATTLKSGDRIEVISPITGG